MLPEFGKCWKRMELSDDDLKRLQSDLLLNSQKYPVMQDTGGLRKMRFALEGRGKSGSVRVVYVDFLIYDTIYLISAYSKNDKDNLSKAERNAVKSVIETLESQIKNKRRNK